MCGPGDHRVAVGRCRRDGRCGCRPSPSRPRPAVLAWLSSGSPRRPVSLVPRRSTGADRQPAGGSGSLGCERVSHLLVRRRRGQRRPDHLGGRCAATSAPTDNGAHLRPRDVYELPHPDLAVNRFTRRLSGSAAGTPWPASCRPASGAWHPKAETGSRRRRWPRRPRGRARAAATGRTRPACRCFR